MALVFLRRTCQPATASHSGAFTDRLKAPLPISAAVPRPRSCSDPSFGSTARASRVPPSPSDPRSRRYISVANECRRSYTRGSGTHLRRFASPLETLHHTRIAERPPTVELRELPQCRDAGIGQWQRPRLHSVPLCRRGTVDGSPLPVHRFGARRFTSLCGRPVYAITASRAFVLLASSLASPRAPGPSPASPPGSR